MKNVVAVVIVILLAASEASRSSTSYATSTWNPASKLGRIPRAVTSPPLRVTSESATADEIIDTFGIESVSESNDAGSKEHQRIVPASAKAALIAVFSATVIGGARQCLELVL